MNEITTNKQLFSAGLNRMAISRLVKKNKIGNLGCGYYTINPKPLHFECDDLMNFINETLDNYPIKPNRVVFSSISLNPFINQLISSTTYIVEVEKEYVLSLFILLKSKLNNVILVKPSKMDKQNYWKPNSIYIVELFKRSPVNKDGSMAIEKLIFDLFFDENIYSLYSGQDINSAIEMLCTQYTINYQTLFAYAKRKNKYKQLLNLIEKYIPNEMLKLIENDK